MTCFVSHNSADKQLAREISKYLMESGIEVWFDEWEIVAGDSITSKIDDGLQSCDVFIFLMSTKSIQSNWVKDELRAALQRRIGESNYRILPILVEECEVPSFLRDYVHIDFREVTVEKYKELLDAINRKTQKPKLGNRLENSENATATQEPFNKLLAQLLQQERVTQNISLIDLAKQIDFGNADIEQKIDLVEALEGARIATPSLAQYVPPCAALNIDRRRLREIKLNSANLDAQTEAEFDQLLKFHGSTQGTLNKVSSLSRDELELLASRFDVPNPSNMSNIELRDELFQRAKQYADLRSDVDSISPKLQGLCQMKNDAKRALDRLDFPRVEELLAKVHTAEIEEAATTAEIRAKNALMQGKSDLALKLLMVTANNFLLISNRRMVEKKIEYEELLTEHGRSYGIDSFRQAEKLVRSAILDSAEDEDLLAKAQNSLGIILAEIAQDLPDAMKLPMLDEAESAYNSAASYFAKSSQHEYWSNTINNLGGLYMYRGLRAIGPDIAESTRKCLHCFRKALKIRLTLKLPDAIVDTQHNLATALSKFALRQGTEQAIRSLREADAIFNSILKLSQVEDVPEKYASSLAAHSEVLKDLGVRLEGENSKAALRQSLQQIESAISITDHDREPMLVCKYKNLLAITLRHLADRSKEDEPMKLLQRAETGLEEALRIVTEVDQPLDWALLKHTLGLVLNDMAKNCDLSERQSYYLHAELTMRDALRVRTKQDHIMAWFLTSANLGLNLLSHGECIEDDEGTSKIEESLEIYSDLLTVYQRSQGPFQWALLKENTARAEFALAQRKERREALALFDSAITNIKDALSEFDSQSSPHNYHKANDFLHEIIFRKQLL